MFLESMIGLAGCYLAYRKVNEDSIAARKLKKGIKKTWSEVTQILKLDGFYVQEIKIINNGVEIISNIPVGRKFEDIEKHIDVFRDNFGCICEMENIRFSKVFKVKLITKDLGKYSFEPVKTYANKLFIAREFDTNPFFIDLDKEGHLLIAGQTGTGKSFVLATILTNLIYNSSDYIEIYLSQIMKGEVGLFSKCKPVKSTQYTLPEVAETLSKVAKIVDDRGKLFASVGCKNLTHYIQKTNKRMKRIFYVIEEVSFFIPNKDADDEQTFKLKQQCWESILVIAKAGRSSGVHFLSVTQRSTVANLPSEVKAQMCCMTMKQRSGRDSENIIDVPDAKDLGDRECYVWGRNGLKLLKVPFVDEDFVDLNKYVPEIILPNVNAQEAPINIRKTTETTTVERVSYVDMRLDEYNKIMDKQKEEVPATTEATETKEPEKKKRGRTKKGVQLKC